MVFARSPRSVAPARSATPVTGEFGIATIIVVSGRRRRRGVGHEAEVRGALALRDEERRVAGITRCRGRRRSAWRSDACPLVEVTVDPHALGGEVSVLHGQGERGQVGGGHDGDPERGRRSICRRRRVGSAEQPTARRPCHDDERDRGRAQAPPDPPEHGSDRTGHPAPVPEQVLANRWQETGDLLRCPSPSCRARPRRGRRPRSRSVSQARTGGAIRSPATSCPRWRS